MKFKALLVIISTFVVDLCSNIQPTELGQTVPKTVVFFVPDGLALTALC